MKNKSYTRRKFLKNTATTAAAVGVSMALPLVFSSTAFANKASAAIDAPTTVKKGTEITIKINVTHIGNNFIHHTKWVYVKANGEEIARWDFSMFNTPESENFSREVKYTVSAPTEIIAEASCNIHGSTGPATLKIAVK